MVDAVTNSGFIPNLSGDHGSIPLDLSQELERSLAGLKYSENFQNHHNDHDGTNDIDDRIHSIVLFGIGDFVMSLLGSLP